MTQRNNRHKITAGPIALNENGVASENWRVERAEVGGASVGGSGSQQTGAVARAATDYNVRNGTCTAQPRRSAPGDCAHTNQQVDL